MVIKSRQERFGTIIYDSSSDKFTLSSPLQKDELLTQKISAPLTLHWILTLKCNARCPYCYELPYLLKLKDKEQTLGSKELEKVIEQFAQKKIFRLYLTGGEPTLSPLLPEILQTADSWGIKTVVNTNGIRLSESLYQQIKFTESRLSFSLDSYVREEHNSARKQKSYDNIVNFIQRACSEGVDVRVISVLQRGQEYSQHAEFGSFLEKLGVRYWFLQQETKQGKQDKDACSLKLQNSLRKEFPSVYIRVLPAIFDSFLYLLPNGDISIHLWNVQKETYGNILDKTLEEIWQKHKYTTVKDHEGILKIIQNDF